MTSIVLNSENQTFSVENIRKNILPKFNIYNADISMVKFKNTDKQRAVYKISYKDNYYCLKKVYFSEADLLYVYSALEWLYRNGLNVPNLLPSYDGGRFIKYDGMLFILTPWIDGIKCDFNSYNHIISSTIELAKMHKVSKKFIPIEGSSNRIGFINLSNSNSKHFSQILNCANLAFKYKDSFSKKFLDDLDINMKLCKLSTEISSKIDIDELSTSLCHGDYVNKNILFTPNNSICIIDFDKCKFDYCAHDISYFMRRLLKRESTNWNIDIYISILKAYNSIKPLTKSDLQYTLSYVSFPQKYWKVSRDYYRNISKCNKSAFQSLISKASIRAESHLVFINFLLDLMEKVDWNINNI